MTEQEKSDILQGVQQITLARLGALVSLNSQPQHTNTDGIYSPAQWWYDRAHTTRRTLQTSAAVSFSDAVLSVNLTYTVT